VDPGVGLGVVLLDAAAFLLEHRVPALLLGDGAVGLAFFYMHAHPPTHAHPTCTNKLTTTLKSRNRVLRSPEDSISDGRVAISLWLHA